jgi:hypothetical protein
MAVQLGDAVFGVMADPGFHVASGVRRVAVDPQALQIWPVEE